MLYHRGVVRSVLRSFFRHCVVSVRCSSYCSTHPCSKGKLKPRNRMKGSRYIKLMPRRAEKSLKLLTEQLLIARTKNARLRLNLVACLQKILIVRTSSSVNRISSINASRNITFKYLSRSQGFQGLYHSVYLRGLTIQMLRSSQNSPHFDGNTRDRETILHMIYKYNLYIIAVLSMHTLFLQNFFDFLVNTKTVPIRLSSQRSSVQDLGGCFHQCIIIKEWLYFCYL